MRYIATSLLLAWIVTPALGVEPATKTGSEPILSATDKAAQAKYGVLEETPNQRRTRLGMPIVASYPAPDYGELIETPNARRQRLGLPMPGAEAYGKQEETPNARRIRLNAPTVALQ
jgi:hypothetical protein